MIDDSETNLYLIKSVFKNRGDILVFTESIGRRTLETVKKITPEIILLDLMMPDIDGFRLLDQLKSSSAFRKIPVVILSAIHEDEIVAKTKQMGAVGYIKKPVDIDEVEEIINRLLKDNKSSSPSERTVL